MTQPKVIDDDRGGITVALHGHELRGWSYANDTERRAKMVQAHEYAEGWWSALSRLKSKTDNRLNDYLCEMKPGYDDSIVGFNEAWDIMREAFADLGEQAAVRTGETIPLKDLPLFWQGRANALRIVDSHAVKSDVVTLETAKIYEGCATELRAALKAARI